MKVRTDGQITIKEGNSTRSKSKTVWLKGLHSNIECLDTETGTIREVLVS